MSAVVVTAPDLVCRDCWEQFGWESSPDPDRCLRCAEAHASHEGTALVIDTTQQVPRQSFGPESKEA